MSSDSDDDCYGNMAQKLQALKSTYVEENTTPTDVNNIISETVEETTPAKTDKSLESDNEDISLDTIIAQHSKRKTRSSGRIKTNSTLNNVQAIGKRTRSKANSALSDESAEPLIVRGRGRKRGSASNNNTVCSASPVSEVNVTSNSRPRGTSSPRGRGRGRSRARSRRPRQSRGWFPANIHSLHQMFSFSSLYPTYNVGEIEDYPDMSVEQPLFSNKPVEKDDDVTITEDAEALDDSFQNEVMSVKVYWRHNEIHKFMIRRYQKLTEIFEFYMKKENVSQDFLLFTYKDIILKSDDTPDLIDYNVAKFIEGGLVSRSVSDIVKNRTLPTKSTEDTTGLKIKFQCQNFKKPFETFVRPGEKMSVPMIICAEHFGFPLDKVKFYFDGDLLSGKKTPEELDLEGGECIDVKIIN